ncbi:DUF3987 domain-containing protein [Curvibacter sp. HBC28]|uniref:DUF3987 domain-containing protein n=1 Tax=Curvibacter microcysteis TaxID=3026419 RepID=A0ABT5MFH9_9BURK|nr:DUF3987 domain-containing protein [Curvibacter sp. HBC28]MDD0815321.1 DUF3987 domain-containing protein [Curvibacter sp. HBC28]
MNEAPLAATSEASQEKQQEHQDFLASGVSGQASYPANSVFSEFAWKYLERKISIVPIAPGSKKPGEWSEVDGWRGMSKWTRFAERLPTSIELEHWERWPGAGIGVVCGKLSRIVALDKDYDLPAGGNDALDAIIPYTPVAKKGAKGWTKFYRYNGEPSKSFDVGGNRVLDILSDGRQTVVPPTAHPSGCNYVWLTEETLDNLWPIDELPQLPDDFMAQVERVLAPYQTEEDRHYQKPARAPKDSPDVIPGERSIHAQYFHDLNQHALANLGAWVTKLVPTARAHADGFRAIATWRACENPNVGIHPHGIMDFGGNYGMTPIDLVMDANGTTFAKATESLRLCLPSMEPEPITMTVNGVPIGSDLKPGGAASIADFRAILQQGAGGQRTGAAGPNDGDCIAGLQAVFDAGCAAPAPASLEEKLELLPWPQPIDPFVDQPAPRFPLDHLPRPLAEYCRDFSAGSGFDEGAVGFSLLVAASGLIDHRNRFNVGPLSVPSFLWGIVLGKAGDGKSPVIKAAMKFLAEIDREMVNESKERHESDYLTLPPKDRKVTSPPPWRQLIAGDTTTEGLAKLLVDNPGGVVIHLDEFSEFCGRMDAYSGTAGKDRPIYLKSFDGGRQTVNRKSDPMPMVLDNFSVGVLTAVQPEKLAQMLQRTGTSDGLFQRFLPLLMAQQRPVDYSHKRSPQVEDQCRSVFLTLARMARSGEPRNLDATPGARAVAEAFHNHMQTVAQGVADVRLAEHYNKFPGFLARVASTLHWLECAATGQFREAVSEATMNNAKAILMCLFRHSQETYKDIDQQGGVGSGLVKAACEAILTKGWEAVSRGDLTRDATGWRSANDQSTSWAIDLLIEFGWVQDITPSRKVGKPGRRSAGLYLVNPEVHRKFQAEGVRIADRRKKMSEAIQAVAESRRSKVPWQ